MLTSFTGLGNLKKILCSLIHGDFNHLQWLVVDIQLVMGGRGKKMAIDPEEYIFAALNIYLDIIQILLYVLLIIGLLKN